MTTTTRKARISQRKVAFMGDEYRATWLGMRAVYTTWEGERLIGTITHWSRCGNFPCVTFTDGTWGRLDSDLEIVTNA